MIRIALRELRHHPGRYAATVLAIAISVGFMAAVSVVLATESHALTMQTAGPYTTADLDVEVSAIAGGGDISDITAEQMADRIARTSPNIAQVWHLESISLLLDNGDDSVLVTGYANPPAALSWQSTGRDQAPVGQWQLEPGQVLVSPSTADALHAQIGSQLIDAASQTSLTVVGVTNEPPSRFASSSVFVSAPTYQLLTGWPSQPFGSFLVELRPGQSADEAASAIAAAFADADFTVAVATGEEMVALTAGKLTRNIDTFKYLLWVFAGIAMVVGLITITNTFTILLAQRRRQLGLLRAVGASRAQVRHSIWLEGAAIGLVGAVIGIGCAYGLAAVVGSFTGSLRWGLATPWAELAAALAVGLAITVLACALPARRATSQPVLDALRPAEAGVAAARLPVTRLVICGGLAAVGLTGCLLSLRGGGSNAILLAVAGAALTSFGVLFGAPLFMPALLRAIGRLISPAGVAASTAAKNVVRDPARSSTTASAIMVAIGLVVTLQVGASSLQATVDDKIDSAYPIGLWLASAEPSQALPADLPARLRQADGVSASIVLTCVEVGLVRSDINAVTDATVCAYDPAIAAISLAPTGTTMPDDQILVSPTGQTAMSAGYPVGLADSSGGSVSPILTLQATGSNLVRDAPFALVSPATLAQLPGPRLASVMLMSVGDTVAALRAVTDLLGPNSSVSSGGSAGQRAMIDQVVAVIVDIMTALLAVAVLIALVGVSNTLTLSVIERTRESALLRALGLRRGQLRQMLLIEALLLTLGSALVGVVFGVFFGYVGAHSVVGQAVADATGGLTMTLRLAIDWPQTLVLLAVLVAAAGLASVLPGRRAAAATPVEALAEV